MWNIEVYGDNSHPKDEAYVNENILEKAIELSKKYPERLVIIWGMCRGRVWLLNGEISRSEPDFGKYYLIEDKDDLVQAVIFGELLPEEDEKTEAELMALSEHELRKRYDDVRIGLSMKEPLELFHQGAFQKETKKL